MVSYTFSRLQDTVDSNVALVRQFEKPTNHTEKPSTPRLSRKRDIFLAFVIVSLPLLVIAILLLVFIFNSDRERPALYVPSTNLPFAKDLPLDAFYTRVDPGDFLLVGSWASNIAAIVVAPFMLLFSYAVAREILQHTPDDHEDGGTQPPLLREIMRGAHVGMWHWVAQKTYKRPKSAVGKEPVLRVVDVAGIGLFTATLLT